MAKADLIEQAKALGLELTGDETVVELEAKIAAEDTGDNTVPALMRRRVNRGSRRRMERALKKFNTDIDAAIKEFDLQAFIADEDGNREEDWPLVGEMRRFRQHVIDQVNGLLSQD